METKIRLDSHHIDKSVLVLENLKGEFHPIRNLHRVLPTHRIS